jgi:AraC-like DNA-binding protein
MQSDTATRRPGHDTERTRAVNPSSRLADSASQIADDVEDVVVSAAPFLQLTLEETEGLFLAPDLGDPPATSNAAILERKSAVAFQSAGQRSGWNPSLVGLRQFLTPEEGTGYWDHFRPTEHVILSIMDANYRHTTWVVNGEDAFKLRLVLSGRLLDKNRASWMDGPSAVLTLCPRGVPSGYYLAAGHDTRQVVLSCRPGALTETLGLDTEEIPTVLRSLTSSESAIGRSMKIDINPKIFQAAMEVVTSRFEYSGAFRRNLLEAKCREILCSVLGDLRHREIGRGAGSKLTSRDLNRVFEARDYLANHFRNPPSIPLLARRVGVSQTRLKENFRRVTGVTIYTFVQQQRMKRASELLLSGDYHIAQVARAVGFAHAANFTSAFKRYYGFLPRALKPRTAP